jgi:hypothetical protein
LEDLDAGNRDIYKRNIEENIAYAKGLKPSASQIEAETYRQLRSTDTKAAEAFGKELKNEADIAKLLRGESKLKTDINHTTGEVIVTDEAGNFTVLREGKEKPKTEKAKKLSADEEKSQRAATTLDNIRVNVSGAVSPLTQAQFAELSSWANKPARDPRKDSLDGAPAWVRDTINGLGGINAVQELLKEAGSQPRKFRTPPKVEKGAGTAAQGSNRDGPWSNYPKK